MATEVFLEFHGRVAAGKGKQGHGVSFLIETIEKAKDREGRVAFCGLSPTIAKTFQIMGFLQLATLHQTEQEAVQSLSTD